MMIGTEANDSTLLIRRPAKQALVGGQR